MRTVRVRIEDFLYKRLKETVLKHKTWNDVINEALALYLQKYDEDPYSRIKEVIIEHYYEAKTIKRIFMMLDSLQKDWIRIQSKMGWESDPILLRLVSELGEVITKMRNRLEELDRKQLEEVKEKVTNNEDS